MSFNAGEDHRQEVAGIGLAATGGFALFGLVITALFYAIANDPMTYLGEEAKTG